MDGLAPVAVRAAVFLESCAGVGADSHVRRDNLGVERTLDRNRRLDRRPRGHEDGEEPVAGLLGHLAPRSTICSRTTSLCLASFFHFSLPSVSRSFVEPTMSVKRNVRVVCCRPRAPQLAPRRAGRRSARTSPGRPRASAWRRARRPACGEREQQPRLGCLVWRAESFQPSRACRRLCAALRRRPPRAGSGRRRG